MNDKENHQRLSNKTKSQSAIGDMNTTVRRTKTSEGGERQSIVNNQSYQVSGSIEHNKSRGSTEEENKSMGTSHRNSLSLHNTTRSNKGLPSSKS